MRRGLAIVLASLALVTGMALAAMLRTTPPVAEQSLRVANIEQAIKDLDLIRPPRQKLADDFTLETPEGGRFRLSEHRGKVVFINFWATWCPPCREEMPAMERLYTRYKKDGLVMLAVSVDADPRAVTPFITEHTFTFTVGLDPKMELANAYSVRGLPASFVVDRRGHLTALALGPREWDNAAGRALVEGLTR
jgi:peroxiredoxin